MKKIAYIFCSQFFIYQSVVGQLMPEMILLSKADKQNKEIAVGKIDIATPMNKSLNDYFQIIDTIDLINKEIDLVNIEGCNSLFKLKIHRDSITFKYGDKQILSLESRIPPYQTWLYDITNLKDVDLASVSQELRKKPYDNSELSDAFQSCISYALEGIFRSYGINPEPFFFRRSNLAEKNDLEAILKNLFVRVETLDNIKKKTLKNSNFLFEDQVLILFRNYKGEPIHACFNLYGRTWTKNGMAPYTSHTSPGFVIDSYYSKDPNFKLSSVSRLEIYRLNIDVFD